MFDNAGSQIRHFAFIFFVICEIATVIASIVVLVDAGGFLGCLIVLIAGTLSAYLTSLFLSAFGELVENSSRIADSNEELATLHRQSSATTTTTTTKSTAPVVKSDSVVKPYTTSSVRPSVPRSTTPDFWTCPNCGRSNHRTAGTCGCGTKKPS